MTYDDYEFEEVTDEDIRAAAAQLIEHERRLTKSEREETINDLPDLDDDEGPT